MFLRVFDKARYSYSASYFRSHQSAWKHRILSVKHAISIGKITENIDNLRRKPLHRNTTSERLCDRQIVKPCVTREEIAKTGSNKTAGAIAFYRFKRKKATENTKQLYRLFIFIPGRSIIIPNTYVNCYHRKLRYISLFMSLVDHSGIPVVVT